MTDRTLPHASAVMNRAATELIMHGETKLAHELASVHRATCDLTHACMRAGEAAATVDDVRGAQTDIAKAIAQLRGNTPA